VICLSVSLPILHVQSRNVIILDVTIVISLPTVDVRYNTLGYIEGLTRLGSENYTGDIENGVLLCVG